MSSVLEAALPPIALPLPRRAPLGGFVAGVLASQVVNNALHIIQPLLIAELSGSLALAALVASAETGVHMLGTLVSGGTADRLGSRMTLILATAGRAASLSIVPAAWAAGVLTLPVALGAYTLDAFVRGFIDTAVHALPLGLADGDRAALARLNASHAFAFHLAAVLRPPLPHAPPGKRASPRTSRSPSASRPPRCSIRSCRRGSSVGEVRGEGPVLARLERLAARRLRPGLARPVLGLALFNLFPLPGVVGLFARRY